MSLYRHHVFPWVLDRVMDHGVYRRVRREALAPVGGRVLEIGLGTGLNLGFYPEGIRRIVGVDSNPGVARLARRRAAEHGIEVEHHQLSAEQLPFDAASFDTVVSTFTLCSIPDVQQALAEVRRVLRPQGEFIFLEHGLSPDPAVARWQRRMNPIWSVAGDGCHLDRDATEAVRRSGLALERVRNFYLPKTLKIAGYMYLGAATKS
jgi:ubiquinone/menaquinone biosynthesis C-methylase UbiE